MEPRWAIFISGRGSNLQSLLDLKSHQIKVVVSSSQKCLGLFRARRAGVPVIFFGKNGNWQELISQLKQMGVNSIFLLGYMKLVPAELIDAFTPAIYNLHPSLLPQFPGLDAINLSYQAQGRMGATVHQVTTEMDAGPILLQKVAVTSEERESLTLRQAEFLISRVEQQLVEKIFLNPSRGRK
ncbi:MAG: formyltransferase family protein [Bdellovibrionia bacterium]